jgi:hypothetical protein
MDRIVAQCLHRTDGIYAVRTAQIAERSAAAISALIAGHFIVRTRYIASVQRRSLIAAQIADCSTAAISALIAGHRKAFHRRASAIFIVRTRYIAPVQRSAMLQRGRMIALEIAHGA